MDTIYKKYPYGSILLWRTREQLKHEKKLGPYALPERDPDLPVDYILDGQQRITSIFGVFQSDLEPDGDDAWTHVYFDLTLQEDPQDTQITCLATRNYDKDRYFPLRAFFNTVEYRKATKDLSDTQVEKIDKIQEIFKEAEVPTQTMATDDRTAVAIVFERVNQRGVELDVLQLLCAWTWSEEFDLQRKFSDISETLEGQRFGSVDNDLILKCVSGVISEDASPDTLIKLNGNVVRDNFERIENGIRGAVDFLRRELRVFNIRNMPYPAMLVPLVVFFSVETGIKLNVTPDQNSALKKWFWQTSFSRRYNSQSIRSIKDDISEIHRMKRNEESSLGKDEFILGPEWFLNSDFRINSVSSKAFVLLLAQLQPLSFLSGQAIDLSSVMQAYNRAEFHHMYPKAYLARQENNSFSDSCLANICILSSADNSRIRARAPSEYRSMMPKNVSDILSRACASEELFRDNFDAFVRERSDLLSRAANQLIRGRPPV